MGGREAANEFSIDWSISGTAIAMFVVLTIVLIVVAVMALRRRCPDIDPDPPSMELRAESPAVVNLLVNDYELETDAVAATLLDLAARRIVSVDTVGDEHIVRLRSRIPDGLAPHERRVIDHLQDLAIDGVVPAGALTTGKHTHSYRWWRHFRRDVAARAQEEGVSKEFWGREVEIVLGVGLAIMAFLLLRIVRDEPWDVDDSLAPFEFLALFSFAPVTHLMHWLPRSGMQRPTAAGLVAARHWLGVRAYLGENVLFAEAPPSSVAIWDRNLAYGAALGVAPGAARPLDMGPDRRRRAWSRFGGRWRHVRIRYPHLAWSEGKQPFTAMAAGAAMAAGGALLTGWLLTTPSIGNAISDDLDEGWVDRVDSMRAPAAIVVAFAAAWGATLLVRGVLSAGTLQAVDGEIVRLRQRPVLRLNPWRGAPKRRWHLALDTGAASTVRAMSVREEIYKAASEGDHVRVTMTPVLRHVRSLERIGPSADHDEPRRAG